ncbi:MAG: PAS/PAC sensor signal transduction histidine kinase [uncultured bacterium]|nr:MAG: PAS/PAC sensor signal transduction histidine kinase [uncultured bacterium]
MDDMHALFEALTDSAVLLDKAGRIVDWNPGAAALFGYPKKEVIGRSLNLIYHQNYPFPKIIQETLTQQKKWIAETEFIRKNGTAGTCKTSATLINTAQPHKPLALITHQNISVYKQLETELHKTNQKIAQELNECLELFYTSNALLIKSIAACEQVEKNLRESELRFHLLAENATDIISRHAPDGTYLYVSPSCKTLLGYLPEDLVGNNASKFVHYDDIGKLKRAFNRRKDTAPYHMLTYRIRRKEGDYRWFESNIRAIRDEESNSIREIQSASRDVTDHILDKKARLRGQQLAHVFRLSTMEEMASGMAHEISQPLAAVVNYTQGCVRYLQKDNHDPTQLAEIMNKAVAQAERAGEVIHRLKNFFCKGQLVKTPCKMNSLIRETVSLIRNDLNRSKTKIEFNLDKELQIISADRIQLQQVMLNLIQNGIEAMHIIDPRQRRIQIQTKTMNANSIEVTISDTGPGFTKDMVHKVFEPFFTTKANGCGMGLAICRSIIEAHGGQFTINPNTSHHSWIRFVLPVF